MCGFQNKQRGFTFLLGLHPTRYTQAPLVSRLKAWKLIVWHGRYQIVALGCRKPQKFICHYGTNSMCTRVLRYCPTQAVSKIARHGLGTADFQDFAKNIFFHSTAYSPPGDSKLTGFLAVLTKKSNPNVLHGLLSVPKVCCN